MQQKQEFAKVLGSKEVLALAFGAMIGWGWIVLTGDWIQAAGSVGAITAMALGSLIIVFIGLAYAELASAMPQAGGAQVFTQRAFGRLASFICTWSLILGYVSVVAFEAVALPTVLDHLSTDYQKVFLWNVAGWDVYLTWALVGMAGTVLVTCLNYFGVENASAFQKCVTLLIVAVGVVFVLASGVQGQGSNMQPLFNQVASESSTLSPFIVGMLPVLMIVPFMFVGFDVIPQTASEINVPPKMIGKLLVVSVLAAMVFYCAIIWGVGMALPSEQMSPNILTTPQAMEAVFNSPWAAKIMVLAGLAGIITSWNAFFIGGSRAIYALAKAKMLPQWLAYLHPKYRTPTRAVLLIGALTFLAPLLGRKALLWFANAGSLAIVIAYFLVCLAFLVLRRTAPDMPRPFKVAGGKTVGLIAVVSSAAMIYMYLPLSPSALIPQEWAIFGVWMVLGALLFIGSMTKRRQTAHTWSYRPYHAPHSVIYTPGKGAYQGARARQSALVRVRANR